MQVPYFTSCDLETIPHNRKIIIGFIVLIEGNIGYLANISISLSISHSNVI